MKDASEFWLLSLDKISPLFFYIFIFFLPTQLGKHFWFSFSYVLGTRIDYLSPTLYVTDAILLFLFLATILKKKIVVSPYFSLVVLFLSLGVFFSQSPLLGWYGLVKFLELSFFVWYVVHEKINSATTGLVIVSGVLLESILAFLQFLHQGSLGGLFYFLGERSFTALTPGVANASIDGVLVLRPYGTFSHPNMLAGYVVVAMLLIVFFLQNKKMWLQVLVLSSLLIGTLVLALSLSRVAIASWVLVGAAMVAIVYKRRVGKKALLALLVVLVGFLFSFALFPATLYRLVSLSFGQSLSQRALLAKDAGLLITAHPLLGVGLNNFISSLPYVAKQAIILQPVHNIYLLVAAETGVIGLAIALFALLRLTQKLFSAWKKNNSTPILVLSLALFVILFSGLFDHYFLTLQQGQLLFALVIGLCLRAINSFDTIQK